MNAVQIRPTSAASASRQIPAAILRRSLRESSVFSCQFSSDSRSFITVSSTCGVRFANEPSHRCHSAFGQREALLCKDRSSLENRRSTVRLLKERWRRGRAYVNNERHTRNMNLIPSFRRSAMDAFCAFGCPRGGLLDLPQICDESFGVLRCEQRREANRTLGF